MAGHRGGRAGRVQRRREIYWRRLAEARSDIDRLAIALDHLRHALRFATPHRRAKVVTTLVAEIASTAEELLSHYETRGAPRS
jgi:hypothetical protein